MSQIKPLTSEQLDEIELKREKGISTEEEDVAYYFTLGQGEMDARAHVAIERGTSEGDVVGGYFYTDHNS